jgi:hypothetical protein
MTEIPFSDIDPFDAIPAGKYQVVINEAKLLPTKANDGSMYASIAFKVEDGMYSGKLIFGRYNVKNQNTRAQQIAQSNVRRIYKAVDLTPPEKTLSDSKLEQLLNKSLILDVSLDDNDYRGTKENNPRGYFPTNSVNSGNDQFVAEYDKADASDGQDDIPF